MEIKEIDGKKFIEYSEHKKRRRSIIMQIVFLIVIIYASYAMISAITTLLDNKEIIQSDPLIYGMDVHGFVSCTCFDSEGKDWYSTNDGFMHKEYGKGWVNYSETQYINFTMETGL